MSNAKLAMTDPLSEKSNNNSLIPHTKTNSAESVTTCRNLILLLFEQGGTLSETYYYQYVHLAVANNVLIGST